MQKYGSSRIEAPWLTRKAKHCMCHQCLANLNRRKPGPHKFSKRFFCLLVVVIQGWVLTACSTVYINNAEVDKKFYPGLLVLKVTPGADYASVVIIHGVGLTVGSQAATLGYLKESIFMSTSGGACRAIIVVNTDVEVENLIKMVERLPSKGQLCVFNKKGNQ